MPAASFIEMPYVVIDVDTTAPWSPPDGRTWRGRHPVPTVVLLAVCVVLVLTGPGLLRSSELTLAWQLKATTRYFWLTSSSVYSLDSVGDGTIRLSAHERNNQRVMWSLPITGPLARLYATRDPLFASILPPTSVGVRTSVVVNDATDTYPVAAIPLVYLTDGLIVTIDRDPAVPPGPPTGVQTGLEWTHLVTVRDLNTRAVLWTRRLDPGVRWSLPGVRAGTTGIVGLPAGADWMVTDTVDGRVDLWDLRTGATRASRLVGSLASSSFITALPGSVVVGQVSDIGQFVFSAYDPVSLAPVWRLVPPLTNAEPISCEPGLCLVGRRAVWIVNPYTMLVTARVNGVEMRPGPPGEVLVAPFGRDTMVVSSDTGQVRAIDGGLWRNVDATAYRPDAVVVRLRPFGRADIGLLNVRRASVVQLGQTSQWSPYYDCLAVATTVACDDGSVLSVWRMGNAA